MEVTTDVVLALGSIETPARDDTDRGPLRFEQSAAIVGPNDYGPVVMQSGFSLYTVSNGVIDGGSFVVITSPRP